ncbi:MAG: MmcQ/YjbR family DNA-binding protein [Muribaculaceae bacterium]|nr:MmcQ/YjbR family DNA-binding protein [Muribaculaceae bacterium]
MDIFEFREYCLSLGEVTEKTPFGKFAKRYDSILVFYVLDHMFCFVDMDNFTFVNIRSTPEEIEKIRDEYTSVSNPINQSLKYWIQLNFHGDISSDKIMSLVSRAYDIVKAKYSKSGKLT